MKNVKGVGTVGAILGIFLSRFLGEYFGFNSTMALLSGCILILLGLVIYFIIIRQVIGVIFILSLSIPAVMGTIGIYLDNLFLQCGSILSIFTISPMILIFMKKIVEKKKK